MATDEQAPLPVRIDGSDVALPDGGRRTVVVSPDEVWGAPVPSTETPEEIAREARRSFFAPIVMVIALSAALLVATLLVLVLALRFAR